MPDTIECPSCQRKLQVPPEILGREVVCRACGTTFRAENTHVTSAFTSAPLPSDAVQTVRPMDFAFAGGEFEATIPLVGNVEGWRRVRSGITLIWAGTLISVGLAVLAMCGGVALVGMVTSRTGGGFDWLAPTLIFVGVAVIGSILTHALQLVGHVFCLWSPSEHKAKPLAIACLILFALGFGLQMLGSIVSLAEGGGLGGFGFLGTGPGVGMMGSLLSYLGQAIELIEVVVLLVFLRTITRCIRNRGLEASIRNLLFLGGAVVALGIAFLAAIFLGELGGGMGGTLALSGIGCACMFGVLGLVALILYISMLGQMREALASYIRRLERV